MLRRCAAAGLRIDKPCKPQRQQLQQFATSSRSARLKHAGRPCALTEQQDASPAVSQPPDSLPPPPLNVIENAAAQLGGAFRCGTAMARTIATDTVLTLVSDL